MKNALFICFILCGVSSVSQIVCDSVTKKPIENVTIASTKNSGTITNKGGIFTVDYFGDFKLLKFSHLSYHSKEISNFRVKKFDTIFLKPSVVVLDEIILHNFNARDTLIKAIKRIPANYYFKPFNLNGFYRESVIEDTVGVAMTEVSFITYNKGSSFKGVHKAKIIKGRRSQNNTAFRLDLIGGVFKIIQTGDMVRQRIGLFNMKSISKHNFKYLGSVKDLDDTTYIIDYTPSDDNIYNNRKGQLFIDSKTLAITKVIVKTDKEKREKIIDNIYSKLLKSKKATYFLKEVDGIVKYKKIKNKYFLSFINLSNSTIGFLKGKTHNYELNAKLIITKVNTQKPKKIRTNYNVKKGFNKQVKKIPSSDYWNEDNILLFSTKDIKVLKDIKNANN